MSGEAQAWTADRRIRTRSTPNVETERLVARLAYIASHPNDLARWDGALHKRRLRDTCIEVIRIMRELRSRGIEPDWPYPIHESYMRLITEGE